MAKAKEQVETLVKSYKKLSDKTIQRSELLKRNKMFKKEVSDFINRVGLTFFEVKDIDRDELEKESADNSLLQLNYPVEDSSDPMSRRRSKKKVAKRDKLWKEHLNYDSPIYWPPKNLYEKIENKVEIMRNYKSRWNELCERWHIESEWDGDINTLGEYVRQNVEGYYEWDHDMQKHSLYIAINEWTTLEDVKSRWDEIERLQNDFWGKKERRPNFARDLIWHDLSKAHKLTPTQIATLWDKEYPKDVDLLVLRRFRKDIEKGDLGGKIWEDNELLKEVKSGQLKSKYKSLFDDERHYYVSGKIKKGSKFITTPKPFIDVIKKAIKRMNTQISESSMPPLPNDRAFVGLPPQRIF